MKPQQHNAKTIFAGNRHPITGASMTPKKAPAVFVDPEQLSICNDPLPNHRAKPGGKYDEILKNLKVGQCIKCPPADVGKITGALRKFIGEGGDVKGAIRSMSNYGDGMGRVWLVALPAKTPKAAA